MKAKKEIIIASTPENTKIGVPKSKIQEFNGSGTRHVVNLFAGGIPGLLSLGLIQNDSHVKYEKDYNTLNLPFFLIISNNTEDAFQVSTNIMARSSRFSESKDEVDESI